MKRFFCLLFIMTNLSFLSSEFKCLEWWPYKFTIQGTLTPCTKELGNAYVCEFKFTHSIPFTHFLPTDMNDKTESVLKIRSSHFEWTQGHQTHDAIRQKGDSLYSHWANYVILSTPQNIPIESMDLIQVESPLRLKTSVMLLFTLTLIILVHYFLFLNKSLFAKSGNLISLRFPRLTSLLKKILCNTVV